MPAGIKPEVVRGTPEEIQRRAIEEGAEYYGIGPVGDVVTEIMSFEDRLSSFHTIRDSWVALHKEGKTDHEARVHILVNGNRTIHKFEELHKDCFAALTDSESDETSIRLYELMLRVREKQRINKWSEDKTFKVYTNTMHMLLNKLDK